MTIYIDSEFKCHTTNTDGTCRSFEVPFFGGKCSAFIEGYRYIPAGESWTRSDGAVFHGEMVAPHTDYRVLAAYQQQYEAMMAEAAAAYQEGVDSV